MGFHIRNIGLDGSQEIARAVWITLAYLGGLAAVVVGLAVLIMVGLML